MALATRGPSLTARVWLGSATFETSGSEAPAVFLKAASSGP